VPSLISGKQQLGAHYREWVGEVIKQKKRLRHGR
jgi:hypothetical protein